MKIKIEKVIECSDWNKLVCKTYNKPYNLQQQNGCMDRCRLNIIVPNQEEFGSDESNYQPVKFEDWLKRDPKEPVECGDEDCRKDDWYINLWWERNFFPDLQVVANDLNKKGLLESGEYTINIDW